MYILVVDPMTHTILPVPETLKVIDAKYDSLKQYYSGYYIENVLPALVVDKDDPFDPALAALIALLIVLFVGVITFIVVCCCLRHWAIAPTNLKKKDALIKKAIIDDLNTTENPLWIEQYVVCLRYRLYKLISSFIGNWKFTKSKNWRCKFSTNQKMPWWEETVKILYQ